MCEIGLHELLITDLDEGDTHERRRREAMIERLLYPRIWSRTVVRRRRV